MRLSIYEKETKDEVFNFVLEKLPLKIRALAKELCENRNFGAVNELRIKRNSNLYLIADSQTVKTDIFVNDNDIEEIFEYLCNHSYYAHANTIKEGYIPLGNGVRAGICGSAVLENGEIIGIKEISSINVRIPQKIRDASSYIYSVLKNSSFSKSILIYSLPGVGKTSILRDLILKLNCKIPLIRFSVIDSRNEIIAPFMKSLSCDVFSGYPKGLGIELATRSMTPEIIICDEISSEADASAIIKSSHSGVKIIATTHASSLEELKSKKILQDIIGSATFDYFVGVQRSNGEKRYSFTLNTLNDINKI